ncbi:MAG: RidA family protein [Betaproteobacteria bacterium]|nr:MAG: RidA family protein [Betaproteobacteria bacterium]
MISKRVLVQEGPAIGAGVVEAGPLLFTSGYDGIRDLKTQKIEPGLAGAAEAQCENSYGAVAAVLGKANAEMNAVVRLDHFTSSQDWLPRRQTVRGKFFGRPAPLASTGVAAKMAGLNMLTTAVVAVRDANRKKVLVTGPEYGMGNISSAVLGGPFVFLSGLRGTVDPRSGRAVAEETQESLSAQARVCYEVMCEILKKCGATSESLLRIDCFLREIGRADEDRAARRAIVGDTAVAATTVGLPLGARGEIEVTALALAPGQKVKKVYASGGNGVLAVSAGGFAFVGECLGALDGDNGKAAIALAGDFEAQVQNALNTLAKRLDTCNCDLQSIARLDVYLTDIYRMNQLKEILRSRFSKELPAVVVGGAELPGLSQVCLNAIAVQA